MAHKKNKSYMTIEPMPAPKTFTDRNLDPGYGEGGANKYSTRNAPAGGSISPIPRSISISRTKPVGRA